MRLMRPDWHSCTHLFGSYFLVGLFYLLSVKLSLGYSLFTCTLIAFFLGVIWEALDELFAGVSNIQKAWIFDPRGGDWGDLVADLIGCGLGMGMLMGLGV